MIVWDLDYSLSEPDFWISIQESYHESSNFVHYRYLTTFKWPYFGTAWRYSQTVGHAGSTTGIVHADVSLNRSKVKVTGLLNFRQLAKPCMLAAMTADPLRGFLVITTLTSVCSKPHEIRALSLGDMPFVVPSGIWLLTLCSGKITGDLCQQFVFILLCYLLLTP